MSMDIKPVFLFLLILFNSCSDTKKCDLKPIASNVFDLGKITKETVILKCGKEIDSLILNDKYDIYTEESFKGLMNYRECGHSKSYTYNFRNEPIQVCIDKSENNLELSLYAWFNNLSNANSKNVTESKIMDNREYYTFYRDTNCDSLKSQIKEVVLKGYLIKSITTLDNKKWVLK